MRYAIVKNGVVENIVSWDGQSPYNVDGDKIELPVNSYVKIGCLYDGQEFTFPNTNSEMLQITSYEFFNLFTKAERVAIRAAAKESADLEDWLSLAQAAQTIDLSHADVVAGLSLLESVGLISSSRKVKILNNEAP